MFFSEIVDRIWGDIYTPDKEPPKVLLTAAINNSDLTISVSGDVGFPEGYMLSRGNVVEIEYEQVLIEAYDDTTQQVTANTYGRGYRDTDPDNHNVGTPMFLSVRVPKQKIWNAVAGQVPLLGNKLVYSQTIEVSDGHVFTEPIHDIVRISDTVNGSFLYDWILAPTPTGRRLGIRASDRTNYWCTYWTTPAKPSAPSQTLASANMEDAWADILYYGAMATLLTSPDIEILDVRSLAERLEQTLNANQPPSISLANSLRRVRDDLMNTAWIQVRNRDMRDIHIQEAM